MKLKETVETLTSNVTKRNFIQTVNLTINLKGVDLKNPKNRIEDEIPLPNGKGKPAKIALIATGELAMKAKGVADIVLTDEDISRLKENKREAKKIAGSYDFFLAETTLMSRIGKDLGAVLGPRGKMPKPIPPSADPRSIIESMRKSTKVRTRNSPVINLPVGREDMDTDRICENISAVMKRIESKLEKGRDNIGAVYLSLTMSNSVKVEEW
jgi:large subunit ribosomal protein L1